jgi:phage FluMu protein Com
MEIVKCTNCNKVLLEASGEVKKICPKCGQTTHVVVTSKGIINLDNHHSGEMGAVNNVVK